MSPTSHSTVFYTQVSVSKHSFIYNFIFSLCHRFFCLWDFGCSSGLSSLSRLDHEWFATTRLRSTHVHELYGKRILSPNRHLDCKSVATTHLGSTQVRELHDERVVAPNRRPGSGWKHSYPHSSWKGCANCLKRFPSLIALLPEHHRLYDLCLCFLVWFQPSIQVHLRCYVENESLCRLLGMWWNP